MVNGPTLPQILTPDEIADYLKVGSDAVLKELEAGHLRGFKIGSEWRCTDGTLLDYIGRNVNSLLVNSASSRELVCESTSFTEIGEFDYQWPGGSEHFGSGYETTRKFNGRTYTFKIGFTDRLAAGQMRRRVVVWIDNWPLVEFAGSNDYESDGLLASVIKVEGGKQLRPSGKMPDEYKHFHVARYDSVVQGPYASRNLAIIVSKDDLESMLCHAIIRARSKNRI
jgi:excisionase family DNA binding protein